MPEYAINLHVGVFSINGRNKIVKCTRPYPLRQLCDIARNKTWKARKNCHAFGLSYWCQAKGLESARLIFTYQPSLAKLFKFKINILVEWAVIAWFEIEVRTADQ